MVDGHLVRLNQDGKIVQPEYRMSKDMPIQSVFEMNNKRDPQATKMTHIHNKLKLMRGFNKSQVRRNVREDPSVKPSANQLMVPGYDPIAESRRANASSKLNGKAPKSTLKPTPTINYPHTTPYAQ